MMRNKKTWFIILMTLAGIGLVSQLVKNPSAYMIPLSILGIILFFYKYPPKGGFRMPDWMKRSGASGANRHRYSSYSSFRTQAKKKRSPFKVIQGNRNEPKDKDDKPTYH
jgi:hypothetical protein